MTTASLLPTVAGAIGELQAEFPDATVTIEPDGQGGARVCVDLIVLQSARFQPTTWIGFYITFLYPNSDIYPHYVRPDLVVNGAVTPPLHANQQFMGRSAIMVSRRNQVHDPSETAVLKLHKIIAWLNAQ